MSVPVHSHLRTPGKVDASLTTAAIYFDAISGLILWYAADSLSLGEGASVTTITDKSGHANTGTATAVSYHLNIQNSLPAFYIGGNGHINLTSTLTNANGTWILIWKRVGQNNDYLLGIDGTNYSYLQYDSTWYGGNTGDTIPLSNNLMTIRATTYDGTHVIKYVDGVSSVDNLNAATLEIAGLGNNGLALFGYIFELACYNRLLLPTEISTLSNSYRTKYNF